jgi:hypothetical protein
MRRVKMQKQGSSVRSIQLSGNIILGEMKFLIPPGYNLDSLGLLVQADIRKQHFPFEKLVSYEFLNLTALPKDPRDWHSRLGSSNITEEDVAEAHALFKESGCKTIGNFLDFYLSYDCLLLQKSIKALAESYFEILGLHIMDTFRLSVSSLSSLGAHSHLMRNKSIAIFVPSHARLYSVSYTCTVYIYIVCTVYISKKGKKKIFFHPAFETWKSRWFSKRAKICWRRKSGL